MSASDAHALSAVAFQLAAALDAYEQDVAMLLRGPFDTEAYQRASRRMDQMRMYAAALPMLSVAWVEVMIRHFELTHGIWRLQKNAGEDTDLVQLHAQLREAVQRLARKCVLLMPAA
jgi:hypothetical protein